MVPEPAVDLFHIEMGEGQPVILLHGFPLDHTTWLPASTLLAGKFRCLLPDLRGHGKSPVTGSEATIGIMAMDVIRLMDTLRIDSAIICGHSMGGYISMRIAHEFPDRVCGLGLIATRADADAPERAAARMASRSEVLEGRTEALIQSMSQRLTDREDIRAAIMPVMRRTNPRGIAMAQFAIAKREDASQWLENLIFPVVVVAGGKDAINTVEVSESMCSHLRDCRYFPSPDSTHMVLMEEPGLVARALEETY